MPTQEFTQVRTHRYTLKPTRDTVSLPGSQSYTIRDLSGEAHVRFSDGSIKAVDGELTIPSTRHGDITLFSGTSASVWVEERIPDHPNSGTSRKPFPDQAEHPLERQDDPEPPGPPAVLKTKSPGGDPNVISPAENKQQPQSTVTRLKASGGHSPTLEDLPEVVHVPDETKKALKAVEDPSKAPSVQKKQTGPTNRKGPKTSARKRAEVKRATKPSATTGTGSKSPAASAGATKRQTGETGRGATKKRQAGEPRPNVRTVSKKKSPTRTERKR